MVGDITTAWHVKLKRMLEVILWDSWSMVNTYVGAMPYWNGKVNEYKLPTLSPISAGISIEASVEGNFNIELW